MDRRVSSTKLIITFFISFLIQTQANSQESSNIFDSCRFSYGAKIGLNYLQLSKLTKTYSIEEEKEHNYKPGYSIGIFVENKIAESFYLTGEFNYQVSVEEVVLYPGYNGIVEKEIEFSFINIPVLIKYQPNFPDNLFLLIGPSFNYQLSASQEYLDRVYGDKGKSEIDSELPVFSTALEGGIGYTININGLRLMTELRTQWDLIKKRYLTEDLNNIGEWRNLKIALFFGIQL